MLLFCLLIWIHACSAFPQVSKSSINQYDNKLSANKLLVIVLDGARWDYPHKTGLKGFPRLISQGVHAESMIPIFPTVTIPNLYAIATGLYAENHGLPFNYVKDSSKFGKTFQMSPYGGDYNDSEWWEMAEPMWITATEASLRTHVYLWPGCEVPNRNRTPTHCVPYHHAIGVTEFRVHIKQMLDKFQVNSADFGMVYFEELDFLGHAFGPESQQELNIIHQVDRVIDEMLERIESSGLKVNVIVVSDHGMTRTDPSKIIHHAIDEFVDRNDLEVVIDAGPMTQIFPKDKNKVDKIYEKLKFRKGYRVYKPEEIPEEYHLKNIPHRLPPILLLADVKHAISALFFTSLQLPFNPIPIDVFAGNHGYSSSENRDMRGIFLAFGPDFKKGYEAPAIHNVDVYNLAMHLLHLNPRPNNGSWRAVSHMLKSEPPNVNFHSLPNVSSKANLVHFDFLCSASILFMFIYCISLLSNVG